MLNDCCALYNACLEQRISAYRQRGLSLRFGNQVAELKAVRAADPDMARWSFTLLQQVVRRVDKTYTAFFRRGHGFPRFRSRARFDSADMRVGDGLRIHKNGRLTAVGVLGQIKVVWHRALPSDAKLGSAIISRSCDKWYICFSVETPDAVLAERPFTPVGIDLGLTNLVALSSGETVPTPQHANRTASAMRVAQRAVARKVRHSKRQRKAKLRAARLSARIAGQRRDFAHKLSRSLVDRFSHIALEDLNIAGLARGMLAKTVHNAAWTQLVGFITYKAESAGSVVKLVDPRDTSQTCPKCGTIRA